VSLFAGTNHSGLKKKSEMSYRRWVPQKECIGKEEMHPFDEPPGDLGPEEVLRRLKDRFQSDVKELHSSLILPKVLVDLVVSYLRLVEPEDQMFITQDRGVHHFVGVPLFVAVFRHKVYVHERLSPRGGNVLIQMDAVNGERRLVNVYSIDFVESLDLTAKVYRTFGLWVYENSKGECMTLVNAVVNSHEPENEEVTLFY